MMYPGATNERRVTDKAIARTFGRRNQDVDGGRSVEQRLAEGLGTLPPKPTGRTCTVRVWPAVSHRDVLAGHTPQELGELMACVSPLQESVCGLETTAERELVFAMCSPKFAGIEEQHWADRFVEQEVDESWFDTIARLRVRSRPDFSEVFDVEGCAGNVDTYWRADDATGYSVRMPDKTLEAPRVGSYTIALTVQVPISGGRELKPDHRVSRMAPNARLRALTSG